MTAIRFAKMSGAGNDFIIFDNRRGQLPEMSPAWIAKICRRGMSVGADGVMQLLPSAEADFAMQYFNADGSGAAMCGNGGRCLARFAVLVGAVTAAREFQFISPSGRYSAWVTGSRVRLSMPPPTGMEQGLRIALASGEMEADMADTGVPHVVLFTDHLKQEPVESLGREIRRHVRFQPAGTNVNFAQILGPHAMEVRTYERGVEGETLACGTGAAAAALLAARRGWVESPVRVGTAGGQDLEMTFIQTNRGFDHICQTGEARLVYWGELSPEAGEY